MGERSYLSIGDVLALLRDEFPDITISKIRFLESRGLLVPERTPSGYRKFYDHDVERLRWILRQQREHFLPLKVIKGRLEGTETAQHPESLFDSGELPPSELPPSELLASSRSGAAPLPAANGAAHPSIGGRDRELAVVSRVATIQRDAGASPETQAPDVRAIGRPLPPRGDSGPGRQSHLSPPTAGSQLTSALRSKTEDVDGARAVPEHSHGDAGEQSAERGARSRPIGVTAMTSPADPAPTEPGSRGAAAAGAAGIGVTGPSRSEHAVVGASRPGEARKALGGVSLTAGELAQASGLTVTQVEELESFGLIDGRAVAGVHCYDEDALVVAGLASSFARFGIEARHLRIFKHAAERQAGLYSQVVMPLLRQRNPDARARANDDFQKMGELGASIMTCFTRAFLRDLTGG